MPSSVGRVLPGPRPLGAAGVAWHPDRAKVHVRDEAPPAPFARAGRARPSHLHSASPTHYPLVCTPRQARRAAASQPRARLRHCAGASSSDEPPLSARSTGSEMSLKERDSWYTGAPLVADAASRPGELDACVLPPRPGSRAVPPLRLALNAKSFRMCVLSRSRSTCGAPRPAASEGGARTCARSNASGHGAFPLQQLMGQRYLDRCHVAPTKRHDQVRKLPAPPLVRHPETCISIFVAHHTWHEDRAGEPRRGRERATFPTPTTSLRGPSPPYSCGPLGTLFVNPPGGCLF